QRNIRDFIAAYQREQGTTVILTSHYMADVDALCARIVLVLGGQKRYDGSIRGFSGILGREKIVTVVFGESVLADPPGFERFDPQWNETRTRVDLRVPEPELRSVAIDILQSLPLLEFSMEKLPIERVMSTLLANPQLLR
ncbi:MAG: multidrug ABC transporter ATP-binding protein, partial [Oligoflexus sp.]